MHDFSSWAFALSSNFETDRQALTPVLTALIAALVAWLTCVVTHSNSRTLAKMNAREKAACVAVRDLAITGGAGGWVVNCQLRNVGVTFAKAVTIGWATSDQAGNFRHVGALGADETVSISEPLFLLESEPTRTVVLQLRYESFDGVRSRSSYRVTFPQTGGPASAMDQIA